MQLFLKIFNFERDNAKIKESKKYICYNGGSGAYALEVWKKFKNFIEIGNGKQKINHFSKKILNFFENLKKSKSNWKFSPSWRRGGGVDVPATLANRCHFFYILSCHFNLFPKKRRSGPKTQANTSLLLVYWGSHSGAPPTSARGNLKFLKKTQILSMSLERI